MYLIAFTGHRPNKIGGYDSKAPLRVAVRAAIRSALNRAIAKYGKDNIGIIVGGALGVDQDAAAVAHQLGLPFVVAVPCKGQEGTWPEEAQKRYRIMCGLANQELAQTLASNHTTQGGVIWVSDKPYDNICMNARNRWMVDKANALIAIWDGEPKGGTYNCVAYARKRKVPILYINPKELA